jgi:serine O-acetyltransferase
MKGLFYTIYMNAPKRTDFSSLPSRSLAHRLADELIDFLFPTEAVFDFQEEIAEERTIKLKRMLQELLPETKFSKTLQQEIIAQFFEILPAIKEQLLKDAELFVKADPAAECMEEVIVAYPGFYAIAIYRIAHELYKLKIPLLPRIISEYAHTKTGIDIHPGAQIGNPFFIDHGTGIVIGQTTVIGHSVKMYQGVTLGALAVRKESEGTKRHPTIEDNVILYAGSCILGGDTVIGRDSVIGGNVWLTESVPPLSVVYHKSDVHIRDKSELKEVIDFVI